MKKNLISIIVPVYNVEKYLPRCIDSILSQTYKNLEIILVDDGSPDRCGEICDEYAKNDARIHVIHKENGGLADARNVGLKAAAGQYVMFFDSDDWVAANICETLLQALITTQADIVTCNFSRIYSGGKIINNPAILKAGKIYTGKEALELYIKKGPVELTIACNKLYKKELFIQNNLFYPMGRLHEDEFLCKYLLYYSKTFVYINQSLYYYFQRENSIMGTVTEQRFRDGVEYVSELYSFIQKFYPEVREYAWKRLLDEMYVLLMLRGSASYRNKYLNLLRENIYIHTPSMQSISKMGWKCVLKYMFLRMHLENMMAKIIRRGDNG